jgi:hypothetical protein
VECSNPAFVQVWSLPFRADFRHPLLNDYVEDIGLGKEVGACSSQTRPGPDKSHRQAHPDRPHRPSQTPGGPPAKSDGPRTTLGLGTTGPCPSVAPGGGLQVPQKRCPAPEGTTLGPHTLVPCTSVVPAAPPLQQIPKLLSSLQHLLCCSTSCAAPPLQQIPKLLSSLQHLLCCSTSCAAPPRSNSWQVCGREWWRCCVRVVVSGGVVSRRVCVVAAGKSPDFQENHQ